MPYRIPSRLNVSHGYFSLIFQVGSYDPMPNYNGEALVGLNIDRIK